MRIDAYTSIKNVYQTTKSSDVQRKKTEGFKKDELQISQMGQDYQIAKRAVADAPDIREDKVAEMKQRMSASSYDVSSKAFAEKVISKYNQQIIFE